MFTCPFNEICCPYYDKNTGSCSLPNPEENCDDYIFYSWDEEEGLEWEEDNEEDEESSFYILDFKSLKKD